MSAWVLKTVTMVPHDTKHWTVLSSVRCTFVPLSQKSIEHGDVRRDHERGTRGQLDLARADVASLRLGDECVRILFLPESWK